MSDRCFFTRFNRITFILFSKNKIILWKEVTFIQFLKASNSQKKMTSLIKNDFHSPHVNKQMLRIINHSLYKAPKLSTGKMMRIKGQCLELYCVLASDGSVRSEPNTPNYIPKLKYQPQNQTHKTIAHSAHRLMHTCTHTQRHRRKCTHTRAHNMHTDTHSRHIILKQC